MPATDAPQRLAARGAPGAPHAPPHLVARQPHAVIDSASVRTAFRLILIALLVMLVADRFVGPARTNPVSDPAQRLEAVSAPPEAVQATLRRACYDCHSHDTRWPGYAKLPPVSWFVINHVNDGRKELNFSTWGAYALDRRARKLTEICEMVEAGTMPLRPYVLMHDEARLAPGDVQAICAWTRSQPVMPAATAPAPHE